MQQKSDTTSDKSALGPYTADETIMLSVKELPNEELSDKPWVAVITRGGHPVLNPNLECEVLDVNRFSSQEEANMWFQEILVTRPWMKRN